MKTLRELYKIGKGPSSSHTMGPERACRQFKKDTPEADFYKVILYGSLSKTGEGHGTDRVIKDTLAPVNTEVVFSDEELKDLHPNTMYAIAYKEGTEIKRIRVESVGGGNVVIDGVPALTTPSTYPENSFAEINQFCKWRHISLVDYVEMNEGEEIWDFLEEVWSVMKNSVNEGITATGVLPGGLHLDRKARILMESIKDDDTAEIRELKEVCAYAYAVAEQNADNGTIVTAPTCGACGVVPAVLMYMQKEHGYTDDDIIKALAAGGIFGNLIRRNASISGAECGCQAEIGTATSMAAAAVAQLLGYSIDEAEYAAEIAMEHSLGLTCDPICGLVQIPCIERNAVAAQRAIDAARMAHILVGTRNISFDMVVRTMYETGINLSQAFRETAEGGLAKYYSRGRKLK
ncbi:MAG: L-serine ammonia-lyase, iron-sulfur-dependent, subunit alpha [Clostridia bacterium]|nr:L-serine ammonia-lyase, iron-sulfur-dependent, subunit alpha [Clostridia bacterium]